MLTLSLCLFAASAPLTGRLDPAPTAPGQEKAAKTPVARFSVDHFDFGAVVSGAAPSGELVIENIGDAPLAVRRIGVTCECAKLHLSTPTRPNVPIATDDEGRVALELAPGDKATLKLTVDSSKLAPGPFEKRLLVVTSDPQNGAVSLPFKLQIERAAPPAEPRAEAAGKDARGEPAAEATDGARAQPRPGATDDPSAPPVDPALAPKLELDSYKVDFGTVYRGEKLHHTFTLKNSGKSDLTVQEIRNGCACAASKLVIDGRTIDEKELKESRKLGVLSPGEEAQLEVELKTAAAATPGKDAPLSKPIRIYTNDPARAVVTLVLEATMSSPFTVVPDTFDFGVVRKGAGAHQSATVSSDQLGEFVLTSATSPNPELMTVSATKVEVPSGQPPTWRIDVDISKAAPLGAFSSHVELQVAHDRVKEIILPVHLTLEPNVAITDNRPDKVELLDFEVMTIGTAKTIELEIENGDPTVPYLLESVALGTCRPMANGFAVDMVEIEKGMKYLVKLTAPAELGKSTYFQGDIVLNAKHPDLPLRKVRFRGWYQPAKQDRAGSGK